MTQEWHMRKKMVLCSPLSFGCQVTLGVAGGEVLLAATANNQNKTTKICLPTVPMKMLTRWSDYCWSVFGKEKSTHERSVWVGGEERKSREDDIHSRLLLCALSHQAKKNKKQKSNPLRDCSSNIYKIYCNCLDISYHCIAKNIYMQKIYTNHYIQTRKYIHAYT